MFIHPSSLLLQPLVGCRSALARFFVGEDFVAQAQQINERIHIVPVRKLKQSQTQMPGVAHGLRVGLWGTPINSFKDAARGMAQTDQIITSVIRRPEGDVTFCCGERVDGRSDKEGRKSRAIRA